MRDEKDPGRVEDLQDELEGENGLDASRGMPDKNDVGPQNSTPALGDCLSSALHKAMQDPSNSAGKCDISLGTGTADAADAADETARLDRAQSSLSARAHLPNYPSRTTPAEDGIESIWRAPPLPSDAANRQEDFQPQKIQMPDACENRPKSPPGPSLWAPQSSSSGGKKYQLARRRDLFTPLSKPSGPASLSTTKSTHYEANMCSPSYIPSKMSSNQNIEPGPTTSPSRTPIASSSIASKAPSIIYKSVCNQIWTQYDDHKLHYLKSEAGMTNSQLTASFPGRSETEIEERWFHICLANNDLFYGGTKNQENKLAHSIEASEVRDHGKAGSSIRRQTLGDQKSPPSMGKQSLQISETVREQISLAKPRNIELLPSSDPKSRPSSPQIPDRGTTMDLAIDLTLSDGEETIERGGMENLPEDPQQKPKQAEGSAHLPQGLLKRVTKKHAGSDKPRGRLCVKVKYAIAGNETDASLPVKVTEAKIPHASESLSQEQLPPPRNYQKKRLSARLCHQKPLASSPGVVKVHTQRPSRPIISSSDVSTDARSSSSAAERSAKSTKGLEVDCINYDSCSDRNQKGASLSIRSLRSKTASAAAVKKQSTESSLLEGRKIAPLESGRSDSHKLCTKCSAKPTLIGASPLRSDLFCSTCFSRILRRSCSLERSISPCETGHGKDNRRSGRRASLYSSRNDFEDTNRILEPRSHTRIATSGVRPQKQTSSLSVSTSPNPRTMKPKSSSCHAKALDDLSDDELSLPAPKTLTLNPKQLTSSFANRSRRKSAFV